MKATSKFVVFLIDKNMIYSYNNKIASGEFIMIIGEGKLKIVGVKKCFNKVDKALLSKCYNNFWAVMSIWITCQNTHDYLENGKTKHLILVLIMLYCFYGNLKNSRENTKVINDNLDEELDLEEQALKEELVK